MLAVWAFLRVHRSISVQLKGEIVARFCIQDGFFRIRLTKAPPCPRSGIYGVGSLAKRMRAARQGTAGHGRAGQGTAGQGRAGQGRAGQGRAGHGRAGQGRPGQRRAAQGSAGQRSAGQRRAAQGSAGQRRAAQGSAGQRRAGQGRAGQGRAGQGRAGQLIAYNHTRQWGIDTRIANVHNLNYQQPT